MKKIDIKGLSEEEVEAVIQGAKENPLTIEELKMFAEAVDFDMRDMTAEQAHAGIYAEATSMLDHLVRYVDEGIDSDLHPELMTMDEEMLKNWRELLVHVQLGLFMPSRSEYITDEDL